MSRAIITAALLASLPGLTFGFGEIDPSFISATVPNYCGSAIGVYADKQVMVQAGNRAVRYLGDGTLDPSWIGGQLTPSTGAVSAFLRTGAGDLLAVGNNVVKLSSTGASGVGYGVFLGGTEPLVVGGQNGIANQTYGAHSSAVQPDDSVVAAVVVFPEPLTTAHLTSLIFTRFDAQGRRDIAFGTGGLLTVPIRPYYSGPSDILAEFLYAWSVQPDGSVEVGSYTLGDSGDAHLLLRRVTPDGSVTLIAGRIVPRQGLANWLAPTAVVDPKGRLLLAAQGAHDPFFSPVFTVNRFTSDGQLDPSFAGGRVVLSVGTRQYPTALWLAPDETLTVFAASLEADFGSPGFGSRYVSRASRLTADGALDAPFAQGVALASPPDAGVSQIAQLDDGSFLTPDGSSVSTCKLLKLRGDLPRANATMIEYYNAKLDHYFITADGLESGLLDANPAAWKRTGYTFGAWMPVDLPGGTKVVRFYGDLKAGPDSHFYGLQGTETEGLQAIEARTPKGQAAWRTEGLVFTAAAPIGDACAPDLTPVYRLYNFGAEKGGVPNHRYTIDASVYAAMQAKGWAAEGVRFCVPPGVSRSSR